MWVVPRCQLTQEAEQRRYQQTIGRSRAEGTPTRHSGNTNRLTPSYPSHATGSFVSPICLVEVPSSAARTNRLLVPSVKLSTVGGRAFPVAGPTIWNSLPDSVISAPCLSTFRQRLKHFCSRPRSLTLSLIPGKLLPTSSGP